MLLEMWVKFTNTGEKDRSRTQMTNYFIIGAQHPFYPLVCMATKCTLKSVPLMAIKNTCSGSRASGTMGNSDFQRKHIQFRTT